jgi:hypothetical protein
MITLSCCLVGSASRGSVTCDWHPGDYVRLVETRERMTGQVGRAQ